MGFPNLPSQIGTNYIPSDEEVHHIKNSILPVPTAKLADLDIEINRIQEVLSNLMEQRQSLSTEIEGYRSLISPARRLPIDILQEIFLHTLPTAHNAVIDPHMCPLLLTRICNGWRTVALSTPQLWSSIHIPIPLIVMGRPHQWGPMHFNDLPEEFQKTTLSSLKSISLYDPRQYLVPKEHYDIILDSFLPRASQWKSLALDTCSPFVIPIAELQESDVPLLESLNLHGEADGTNDSSYSLPDWKMCGIVKSHRLRKINFTQIRDNITKFPLKWAQITDIKLSKFPYDWGPPNSNVNLADLIIVLSLSPRLVNFHSEIRLTNIGPASPSSMPSSLPLLHLQRMVFHDGGADCSPLFHLLNAPSLLHLEFLPTVLSSITVLSTFLPQVSGTILSLTTPYAFFVEPHSHSLSQCQKLTSITVKSAPPLGTAWSPQLVDFISDKFLNNLTLPMDHPDRIAPALEVFNCQAGGNFSDAAVLKFIKAKQSRADIAKLKHISIRFTRPRELGFSVDEEVLQYVADGLRVDLCYPAGLNYNLPFAFVPSAGLPPPHGQLGWPAHASNWETWDMQ
ncbi:hypothetical protein M413DRAFT_348408 [Hebeloma cylindrosporum]|uniref:Uncharacterized protein n=1 Tax=Hebeloma cylindrosporum TaxID=76867 RepID=A0A0C3BTW2_HEBCY|nr:hypothetical protein M413DRAFT_348408 [Hebeloma cylindrosporum h7]